MSLFRWASVSVSAAVARLASSRPITLTLLGVMEEYNWCNDFTSGKQILRWARIGASSHSHIGVFALSPCEQSLSWFLLNCCVWLFSYSQMLTKSQASHHCRMRKNGRIQKNLKHISPHKWPVNSYDFRRHLIIIWWWRWWRYFININYSFIIINRLIVLHLWREEHCISKDK